MERRVKTFARRSPSSPPKKDAPQPAPGERTAAPSGQEPAPFFEPRVGYSFAQVRVHADPGATGVRLARKPADWPAWHEEALAAITKIAGPTGGKVADSKWPLLTAYLCSFPRDKARSLHDRWRSDAPGMLAGTDDFAVYIKNKFPSHYERLIALLAELADGKTPPECALPAVNETHLKEAIDFMEANIPFGRASAPESSRNYDPDFWKIEIDKGGFFLRAEGSATKAIDQLFDKSRSGLWTLSCAEFLQAARLYALRKAYADDGKGFDALIGPKLDLREHGSTGIKTRVFYRRKRPTEPMFLVLGGTQVKAQRSVDELVALAPVGSRIMWTNLKGTPPYRNENAIKLGPDLFAGHPYKKVKREQLERKLAREATQPKEPDSAYIEQNIFISQIEIYEAPP